LNRSPHHHNVFSEFTKKLSKSEKQIIFKKYYETYHQQLLKTINKLYKQYNRIIHLAMHSFTPELNGKVRETDIGLLYDPKQSLEKEFCHFLKAHLKEQMNNYIVKMNYPYKGISDGLPTILRKRFTESHYLGVEIEVNQKHLKTVKQRVTFSKCLAHTLKSFVQSYY
jgi:predicted N-formylglutamate amidohydrolase